MISLVNHVCCCWILFPICTSTAAEGKSRAVVLSPLRKHLFNLAAFSSAVSILGPANADQYSYEAKKFVQGGMSLFRSGDVTGSLQSFDSAISANPEVAKFSWQRGISLYYLGKYKECGAQFERDVEMNPTDSEEILWAFMCSSKEIGFRNARESMLVLPRADPRPIMRNVYDAFSRGGETDIASLLGIGESYGRNSAEYFYSRLYAALYFDADGEVERSKKLMQEALDSYYGKNSRDYMTAVARVHLISNGVR
jgi:tetratricopeptide (TPR) repeat protein